MNEADPIAVWIGILVAFGLFTLGVRVERWLRGRGFF